MNYYLQNRYGAYFASPDAQAKTDDDQGYPEPNGEDKTHLMGSLPPDDAYGAFDGNISKEKRESLRKAAAKEQAARDTFYL